MNRKAKFAYGYIIIGFVLFLTTLIFILNKNVNLAKLKTHSNFPKINVTSQLSLFVVREPSNEVQDFDLIELNWYCGLKYSISENTLDVDNGGKEASSVKEIYRVDLKHAEHWLKLFSLIICSSEQVYFGMLIWVCVSSAFLCIYGCIRFYKYDIKLLENAAKFNSINSFTESYHLPLNSNVLYDDVKRDKKTCSIILEDESLTGNRWICCRDFFKSPKNHAIIKDEKKCSYGIKSSLNRLKNSLSSESNINFIAYMNSFKAFNQLNPEKPNTDQEFRRYSFIPQEPRSYPNLNVIKYPPINQHVHSVKPIEQTLLFLNDNDSNRHLIQKSCYSKIDSKFGSYSVFRKNENNLQGSFNEVSNEKMNMNDKRLSKNPIKTHICMDNFTQRKTKFDQKLEKILNNNERMYNTLYDTSIKVIPKNDV